MGGWGGGAGYGRGVWGGRARDVVVDARSTDLSAPAREEQDCLCILQQPVRSHWGGLHRPQALEEWPQRGLPVARVGQSPHLVAAQIQLMHQ